MRSLTGFPVDAAAATPATAVPFLAAGSGLAALAAFFPAVALVAALAAGAVAFPDVREYVAIVKFLGHKPAAAPLPFFGARAMISSTVLVSKGVANSDTGYVPIENGTLASIALSTVSRGTARAETYDAEMASNVMMDPKFFMMKDEMNKRQAWEYPDERIEWYGAQLCTISQVQKICTRYQIPL